MKPLETCEHRGLIINLHYATDSECPQECFCYDNAIIWATWERNSIMNSREYRPFDDKEDAIPYAEENGYTVFPLYKFEHGGVAYSISEFACKWDSGQVGYLLLKNSEFPKPEESAETICETFTQWCNGEVYGYVIEQDGEEVDSCWGFYGMEYCLKEARSQADYWANKRINLPSEYQAAADQAMAG